LPQLTHIIAALGGLFSLAMVIYAGDHSNAGLIVLLVIFGLWAVTPFIISYWRTPIYASHPISMALWLAATVAAVAFLFYAYWFTFIDNSSPDAQDGLVLLIVPLYQTIGLVLIGIVAGWLRK
jgi:hypothetical protein